MKEHNILKINLSVLFLLLSTSLVLAQSDAKITAVSGNVEIRAPGASWQAATVGMSISAGTKIATGFNSTAVLQIASAQITVKPLTRITLEELVRQEGQINTSLYLRSGNVEVDVKKPEDESAYDFRLRSPVSTAAVRGTRFPSNGFDLVVVAGEVMFINLIGRSTSASGGEGCGTNTGYDMVKGEQAASEGSDVEFFTNSGSNVNFNRYKRFWRGRLRYFRRFGGSSNRTIIVLYLEWGP